MKVSFLRFLMEIIGAFIVWMFKGFKGKFNDEMTGPYDSGMKSWRNAIISALFIFLLLGMVKKIPRKKTKEIPRYKIEYRLE